MEIIAFKGQPYYQNTYLIIKNDQVLIVDAGFAFEQVKNYIANQNLNVLGVLITHFHFDHVAGINDLCQSYDVKAWINEHDYVSLIGDNLASLLNVDPVYVDSQYVKTFGTDEVLNFGPFVVKTKNLPGHSRGSTCFFINDYVFTGDTLFYSAIGRSDLPTGDARQLNDSLQWLLANVAPEMTIYPGHGMSASFKTILDRNRFLKR